MPSRRSARRSSRARRQNKKVPTYEDKNGWGIPAGLFVGLGLGLLYNQVAGFLFLGLGLGFLLSYMMSRKSK